MADIKETTKKERLEPPPVEMAPPMEAERVPEKKVEVGAAPAPEEKAVTEMMPPKIPAAPPPPPPPPPRKDEVLNKVETILSEDLVETYRDMPLDLQVKFKNEGERIAQVIWQMIKSAKVQAKKIFQMIINWLKMIPGVNRYFLEQESKIKTDRILALSKERQR